MSLRSSLSFLMCQGGPAISKLHPGKAIERSRKKLLRLLKCQTMARSNLRPRWCMRSTGSSSLTLRMCTAKNRRRNWCLRQTEHSHATIASSGRRKKRPTQKKSWKQGKNSNGCFVRRELAWPDFHRGRSLRIRHPLVRSRCWDWTHKIRFLHRRRM